MLFNYFTILFSLVTLFSLPSVVKAQCVAGQTGGTVWLDYDNDGVKDATETQGLSGVTVKAYNATGTLAGTTTTNASGQYSFGVLSPAPTAGAKYRIEFSGLPTLYQPTFNGTNGKTDVQFISAVSCTVNFGVNNPADYCQANPMIVTPCYVNGEALGATITGARDGFVGVPLNFTGNGFSSNNNYLTQVEDIGTTWGVAVQKSTKTIFTSSFLKRHSSFGPNDNNPATNTHTTGGIYAINYSNLAAPTNTLWLDVNTLAGVNTGADPHTTMSGDPSIANRDAAAFAQVAKISLGDLDISEDGTKLYAVNLNQKTLLVIDIATKSLLNAYPIPNPGCKNSDNKIVAAYHFTNTTSSIQGKGLTWLDGRALLTGEAGYVGNTGGLNFNTTSAPQNLFIDPTYGDNLALPLALGNGTYEVSLYFRGYGNGVGVRVFNISLEGSIVKSNFDIEADNTSKWDYLNLNSTGGNNGNYSNFGWVANEQKFTVVVTDGTLNINLDKVSAWGLLLSGIKVTRTTTTAGAASNFRPWGLGVKDGKVYVGGVCSGESSGLREDLSATVYEVVGGVFTSVLSFPLNHDREFAVRGPNNSELPALWEAWSDDNTYSTWDGFYGSTTANPNHHQPILSDIEFDNAGNLLIGMIDRSGNQVGYANLTPTLATGVLEYIYPAGDILKACKSGSSWVIEGSSGCPQPYSGLNSGNIYTKGINGGEFFADYAELNAPGDMHDEVSWGGVAYDKNTNQVIISAVDPKLTANSGGYSWFNNTTGAFVKGYEVYGNALDPAAPAGFFGKANGLGDVELLCNAQPIQIGNYVWIDTDKDGVQDPTEAPLNNITVSLWKGSTQIASTTTNSNGAYYFSSKYILGAAWTGTGADTTLLPNMAYEVRISTTQSGITTPNYLLTTANSTTNAGNDQNDSDATTSGTNAVIALTTGNAGSTNHSYDFGFQMASPDVRLTKTVDNSTPTQGANVVFTIEIKNDGVGNATGVTVHDTLPVGMTFVSAMPNGVYDANTKLWTVGNLNAGASATLTMTVKIDSVGTRYNTAEVHTMNETDTDSSPNNNNTSEDDIARVCVTVPIPVCFSQGKTSTLRVSNTYTNIKWFRNGTEIIGQNSPTLIASQVGEYTITADQVACPALGCCPVKLVEGSCLPCSISATFTQSTCNNNGTPVTGADDYFQVTVSAVSATNGGASGKYEVVLNGTVLNTGGTTYGAPITVGTTTTFVADGASTYQLKVRDIDVPSCERIFTTTATAACSTIPCPPRICLPITVARN